MPYSFLLLPHAIKFVFAATCYIVCYLLLHAVQLATHCSMFHSLIFGAAYHAVSYLLLHVLQFAIYCNMLYSLLFVVACQAICHMFDSLLFVATLCAIRYLLRHAIHFTTCFMACYSLHHAAHAAIQDCMLYSWLFCYTVWEKLGAVNCITTSSTNNQNGLSDKVHCHKM